MAEFNGGNVVFVPMPTAPEMVMWALPGPTGEIPYAEVEALVDAEFDERIGTMTQLEQSTTQAAEGVATAAGEVATAVDEVNTAKGQAVEAAGTATTKAAEANTAAETATDAAELAEQYALDFDLDVTAATGAPGSAATATVSGVGPAYQIALSIPRGDKGAKGDDGEVSQAALDAAVATLVDNAPEALNTLSELASSLGNDPNFATTVSTEIGKRALIDGAPAAYNTLGKLVTALQNHELGGSTDASLLTGALTNQVSITGSTVALALDGIPYEMPFGELFQGQADWSGVADSRLAALESGKSDVGHTHTVADIEATGTVSHLTYLRGDGTWGVPPNNVYSVPTQTEAEVGTATTGRAFSALRVRQAADAAISARVQLVPEFPSSPTMGVLYLKAE